MSDQYEFPPFHAYALAHHCTTCGAQPGQLCAAPRMQGQVDKTSSLRAHLGHELVEPDPLLLLHATRIAVGGRHRDRDIVAAPWPEDQEPGHRYDTLGEYWQGAQEAS